MSYIVQIPYFESASISPNPANMNTKFLLSVSVIEKSVTLDPYFYYSGDLYAGEV